MGRYTIKRGLLIDLCDRLRTASRADALRYLRKAVDELERLTEHGTKSVSTGELHAAIGLGTSRANHLLIVLKRAGYVLSDDAGWILVPPTNPM